MWPSLFFFQAEDGIRDLTVTGVQTCALPIWFGVPKWLCSSGISSCATMMSSSKALRMDRLRMACNMAGDCSAGACAIGSIPQFGKGTFTCHIPKQAPAIAAGPQAAPGLGSSWSDEFHCIFSDITKPFMEHFAPSEPAGVRRAVQENRLDAKIHPPSAGPGPRA